MPKPYEALILSFEYAGFVLLSKILPTSVKTLKSIGLSVSLKIGRCKSNFETIKLFPPTYEVVDSLGPAPKLSNPLSHLPPRPNLSSTGISAPCKEKILPTLVLTESIFFLL